MKTQELRMLQGKASVYSEIQIPDRIRVHPNPGLANGKLGKSNDIDTGPYLNFCGIRFGNIIPAELDDEQLPRRSLAVPPRITAVVAMVLLGTSSAMDVVCGVTANQRRTL